MLTGIEYPLSIIDGNLSLSTDQDCVDQQVLSFLETFENERIQVDYGIPLFLGTSESDTEISSTIRVKLIQEFPALVFNVTANKNDTGSINLEVVFFNPNTNQESNMRVILNV